jgi:hypothetical protein
MRRKLSVVLGILALTLLAACQGGQVELPNPDDTNSSNTGGTEITDPLLGLGISDSNQEAPSNDQVSFTIPWQAIDVNPNTQPERTPLVYFALLNTSGGVVIQDSKDYPTMAGNKHTGEVELSTSGGEYEQFCGRSIGLYAAINPVPSELPAGNTVADDYEQIDEATDELRLPKSFAQQYNEEVQINCEATLTASFNPPFTVNESNTVELRAETTGNPDSYNWSASLGTIQTSEASGASATYTAPEVNRAFANDNITLVVTRDQERAIAKRDIVVNNPDYKFGEGGGGGPGDGGFVAQ